MRVPAIGGNPFFLYKSYTPRLTMGLPIVLAFYTVRAYSPPFGT